MEKPVLDISQLDLDKQYTYADYLTWQFSRRVELIKGWIYRMSPSPLRSHQKLSSNLSNLLYNQLDDAECEVYTAPFDVRLIKNRGQENKEIDTVVQPDISIICDKSKLDDRGCVGPPDMIIEILSKSTIKKDYTVKFNLYEENKVKEYWLVSPEGKSIDVYYLKDGKYEEQGLYELDVFEEIGISIFPKLKLELDKIFKGVM